MSDAISSILSQIRAHQAALPQQAAPRLDDMPGARDAIRPTAPGAGSGASGFAGALSNAIDRVSETQMHAGRMQQAFELGDPRADLARVMVSMQESQVAFRATVEVRNRLVQAYQEVMNMPV